MSNVRAIPVTGERVVIGEYTVDKINEQKAEELIKTSYPELKVITTAEGKRQIPLHDLMVLETRYLREREEAYRKGYEEGQKEGFDRGLHQGQEEARNVVASLSGAIADATQQRHQLLADAKQHILDLVLSISRRLTFEAARIDADVTMSIISNTIDQLLDKSKIKIKVHPDHLPQLEQYIDRFKGNNTAIKEFAMEADPRVRNGGCFIETPTGDIDARLDSMYEIIRQAILDEEG